MARVIEAQDAGRPSPAGDGHATGGSAHHPDVDWHAVEESPEFQELVRRRRAFTIPALAFVFVWYFGFIALAGYAPDFMGESIYEGFTVGYLLALSQFVMTWFFGWLYLRQADRVFDPLAKRAAERARVAPATDGHGVAPTDGHGAPTDGHRAPTDGQREVTH